MIVSTLLHLNSYGDFIFDKTNSKTNFISHYEILDVKLLFLSESCSWFWRWMIKLPENGLSNPLKKIYCELNQDDTSSTVNTSCVLYFFFFFNFLLDWKIPKKKVWIKALKFLNLKSNFWLWDMSAIMSETVINRLRNYELSAWNSAQWHLWLLLIVK